MSKLIISETTPRLFSLQRTSEQQKYGLNINTIKTNRVILVDSVVPNLAAEKAGLRKGDKILAVNGVSVEHIAPDELLKRLNTDPQKIELLVDNSESSKTSGTKAFSERPLIPLVDDEFAKQQSAMRLLLSAIDANSALRSQLKRYSVQKQEPFIGFGMSLVEEHTRPYLPAHKLVYPAIEVEEGSPAASAGMQSGQRVVAINGLFINRELPNIDSVAGAIDESYFNNSVTVFTVIDPVFWADLVANAKLPALDEDAAPGLFKIKRDDSANKYGLSLRTKKTELKHMAFVVPELSAEQAGIRSGDYILEVNGKPVDKFDQQSFLQNVYSTNSDKVELLVVSNQTFAQNLIKIDL